MTIKRVLPSSTYRVAGGFGGWHDPATEKRSLEDFYRALLLFVQREFEKTPRALIYPFVETKTTCLPT